MMRFYKLLLLILFTIPAVFTLSAQEFFWEGAETFSPRPGKFPVSVNSSDFSIVAWQEVTPNSDASVTSGGFINIFLAIKEQGRDWVQRGIVGGPYVYLGTEPSIISMVIDNKGRILIAAASGNAQAEILISENRGFSFSKYIVNLGAENSVAPRLYVRADGGYLLFITRGSGQSLSICYSRSDNGINWSPFEFFTQENALSLNFLPAHGSIGRKDIVFYQSLAIGTESISTYQLYYKTSEDGGKTWTEARRFTTFNDPVVQGQSCSTGTNKRR